MQEHTDLSTRTDSIIRLGAITFWHIFQLGIGPVHETSETVL